MKFPLIQRLMGKTMEDADNLHPVTAELSRGTASSICSHRKTLMEKPVKICFDILSSHWKQFLLQSQR
jgi:hypothetical protein